MIRRILWLMLFVSVPLAEAQTVRITGMVQDAQLGAPIIGAPVYLVGSSGLAVTKENGQFALQDVQAGTYILTVVYEGYSSESDTLVVSGDADIENNFSLHPVRAAGEEVAIRPQTGDQGAKQNFVLSPDQDSLRSELKTVCACFESAVGILNDAVLLRKKYENIEQYQRDREAVEQMNALLALWRTAQYHCLTEFGTELFLESACNRPDEISDMRGKLNSLGIDT